MLCKYLKKKLPRERIGDMPKNQNHHDPPIEVIGVFVPVLSSSCIAHFMSFLWTLVYSVSGKVGYRVDLDGRDGR
jgi:hypothetical protein